MVSITTNIYTYAVVVCVMQVKKTHPQSITVRPAPVYSEMVEASYHESADNKPTHSPDQKKRLPCCLIVIIIVLIVSNILSLGLGYLAYQDNCDSHTKVESKTLYYNSTERYSNITQVSEIYNIFSNETFRYNVRYFGAVGDGSYDDTTAFERAINASALVGGVVYVPAGRYLTTRSLNIPGGVSLMGDGIGSNPRDMSGLQGSIILYRGTNWAVRLLGDCIQVEHITVFDNGVGGGTALGGVILDADEGRYIESTTLRSVLIYRFTSGAGLKLYANDGGAISYCSFYDVRVRNARIGYHLSATGVGGSFTNSHSFYRGAISGGGFAYGLLIEGPGANNNHNFHGLVIEPYVSTFGHIYVTGAKSQFNGDNIRIEAIQQPTNVSMIFLDENTYGSKISGHFSAGLIAANRLAHQLQISTGKFAGASPPTNNEFYNSAFRGLYENIQYEDIPGWSLSLNPSDERINVTLDNSNQILSGHNVIQLSIPPATAITMTCSSCPQPAPGSLFAAASFGIYARYLSADLNSDIVKNSNVYATFDTSTTNVVSSLIHPRDEGWIFVGMTANVPYVGVENENIFPKFVFDNSMNAEADGILVVDITLPTFVWGAGGMPQLESRHVLQSGDAMAGTLSTGYVKSTIPPQDGTFWVLPKDGNTFIISEDYTHPNIARINHINVDRFPPGTTITLLFTVAGVTIIDSIYVNIMSPFTSSAHCSIQLLSLEAGTWIEVSRAGL